MLLQTNMIHRRGVSGVGVVLAMLLHGCASPPPPPAPAVARPDRVALAMDAEINRPVAAHTRADHIAAPAPQLAGPTMTMDVYRGEAQVLLRRIAAARGLTFEVTGTHPHLPLFISVEAKAKPFKEVLADIASQFGARADIELSDTALRVVYKRARTL